MKYYDKDRVKKRNPIVLEMMEMKGHGKHIKSNKAIRKENKQKLKQDLFNKEED